MTAGRFRRVSDISIRDVLPFHVTMCWLLAGCCGLALIHLSVALENNVKVIQKPRFYGIKKNNNVLIYCSVTDHLETTIHWYKAKEYNVVYDRVKVKGERIKYHDRNHTKNTFLYIQKVQPEDSGVYFCNANGLWGPGTQLLVLKNSGFTQAQRRSRMKDGLIIFQGLLLAVCVAAILLRKQLLMERNDSLYEEPETDHIYEGLAIETCGGGLYEELSVYAQAEGAEAPWE